MSTVVVIEQDGAMRTLVCEWLEAAGYDVVAAGSAAGACADLAIVDIPNLRFEGSQVVRDARAGHPRAAVIGMSTRLSRSLPGSAAQVTALGVVRLLAKPLSRDELLAATASAIGPGSPR